LTVVEISSVFAEVRTQFIMRDDAGLFMREFREEFALAERLVERYF
jgi:hypothetical protein